MSNRSSPGDKSAPCHFPNDNLSLSQVCRRLASESAIGSKQKLDNNNKTAILNQTRASYTYIKAASVDLTRWLQHSDVLFPMHRPDMEKWKFKPQEKKKQGYKPSDKVPFKTSLAVERKSLNATLHQGWFHRHSPGSGLWPAEGKVNLTWNVITEFNDRSLQSICLLNYTLISQPHTHLKGFMEVASIINVLQNSL